MGLLGAWSIGFSSTQTTESNGIHVLICADVLGTNLGAYNWTLVSPSNVISTLDEGDCFDVVVNATNEDPIIVNMMVSNPCGSTGGNSPSVPTCGFCLSPDLPSLLTGTTGAGNGPPKSTDCGSLSGSALWYRMIASATGVVTVSTEGSSVKTLLAICTRTLLDETVIACYNGINKATPESRVTFKAVKGTVYWIVVDPLGGSTAHLRIATGFEPRIQSHALSPDGSFTLQSAVGPPITYDLLASSTLSTNTNGWTVVLTTNLTATSPQIHFTDTNVHTFARRFFRIGSDQ